MDVVGPLLKTTEGNHFMIIITNRYLKEKLKKEQRQRIKSFCGQAAGKSKYFVANLQPRVIKASSIFAQQSMTDINKQNMQTHACFKYAGNNFSDHAFIENITEYKTVSK